MENGIKWLNDHKKELKVVAGAAVIFLLGYRSGQRRSMKINVYVSKKGSTR